MSSSAESAAPRGWPAADPLPVVILISGRGSNMRAILDAVARGETPLAVRAVISDRADAAGLRHAAAAGIATTVVERKLHDSRAAFETALAAAIDAHSPRLVVLAGFMRILGADFVRRYAGRMVNIHPSLLPAYPGLDTHRRALADGAGEHGASVHFVTAEVDGGPLIMHGRVPVQAQDTPETLAQRVLQAEHRIYPLVLRWIAEGRLAHDADGVRFDGTPLAAPLDYADFASAGNGSAP
jgi:phosphoribosylglycinamide formyltransferase-1